MKRHPLLLLAVPSLWVSACTSVKKDDHSYTYIYQHNATPPQQTEQGAPPRAMSPASVSRTPTQDLNLPEDELAEGNSAALGAQAVFVPAPARPVLYARPVEPMDVAYEPPATVPVAREVYTVPYYGPARYSPPEPAAYRYSRPPSQAQPYSAYHAQPLCNAPGRATYSVRLSREYPSAPAHSNAGAPRGQRSVCLQYPMGR